MPANNDVSDQSSIQVKPIPEQIAIAGKPFNLDLSIYFTPTASDTLVFTIADFPEGIEIDPETGMVSGTAPLIEIKLPMFVSITATSQTTQEHATLYFPFTVVPPPAELTTETETGVVTDILEDVSFWEAAREWELMKFVQHLISKYYTYILIYEVDAPPSSIPPGKLVGSYQAKSGWLILDYDNAIMAVPHETAFAEYGYRSRLLATLKELFKSAVLDKKNWKTIDISASDMETVTKAWVVAKELGVKVIDRAPSEAAEINYINLLRLEEKTKTMRL